MKRAKRRPRSPFLVWWNEVAALDEGASRFELAEAAWKEAKHQSRKRRAARAVRSAEAKQ